jgi:hypothetical protein
LEIGDADSALLATALSARLRAPKQTTPRMRRLMKRVTGLRLDVIDVSLVAPQPE